MHVKRLWPALALACVAAGATFAHANTVKPGQVAPDFTGKSTSGKTIRLSALHGKTVILDFWTTT